MAVLVHARFDDDHEVSNGVFTLTVLPDDFENSAVMEMNAQAGAISVTNPPPGQNTLPEVTRVYRQDGNIITERLAQSNQIPAGQEVLTEVKLADIFEDAEVITQNWLDAENAELLSAQRSRTLTLDFEYREMNVGWPALASGNNFGRRLIIKQARTLSPSTVHLDGSLLALPIPRDILARALRVTERHCHSQSVRVDVVEVTTDPLLPPDLGHSKSPFVGYVSIRALADLDIGLGANQTVTMVHVHFDAQDHPTLSAGGEAWDLALSVAPAYIDTFAIEEVRVSAAEGIVIEGTEGTTEIALLACETDTRFASSSAYLETLLEARDAESAE